MEASSAGKTTFSKDLKNLLEGLSCMKKDEYPVPRELTVLFSRVPSPSLLEALIVLLFAAKSQGKLDGIGDDDDTVASQESEFLEASKDMQERNFTPNTESTSKTTPTTSDASPVPSIDPTAFQQISIAREELLLPPLSTGSNMFDIDLDQAVNGACSVEHAAEPELESTNREHVTVSTPVLKASTEKESHDDTSNYEEALRTIDSIRMNLQEEDETKLRAVNWKDYRASQDCDDSTVDCSLDSIGITDDEASLESGESKGSGLFNCAVDSILDMVLGPPCLPYCSDSSLSSMAESEESSVGNWDDTDSEHHKSNKVSSNVVNRKSSLMESDFEDIQSEDASSDGWVPDVKKVETRSLTSF
jgi:hypothetical protein